MNFFSLDEWILICKLKKRVIFHFESSFVTAMASRLETRRRMEQSHQTSGPMIITVPSYRISRVTTIRPSLVVKHMTWEEEELAMEKQKQSTTAKWVLNVIAAQEAYEKSLKEKSRFHHVRTRERTIESLDRCFDLFKNKSKRPIRKPSRIEPMEVSQRFIDRLDRPSPRCYQFSSQSPFFPTTSFYPEKHQVRTSVLLIWISSIGLYLIE